MIYSQPERFHPRPDSHSATISTSGSSLRTERTRRRAVNSSFCHKELGTASAQAQAKRYPLESVEGLRFHNVTAEPSVLQGKRGLRVTISEETLRRIERTQQHAQGLVWIEDLDFSNGVIEAEIAGSLAAERSTRLIATLSHSLTAP